MTFLEVLFIEEVQLKLGKEVLAAGDATGQVRQNFGTGKEFY